MINNEKKYELLKFEDGEFSLDVNVSPNDETVWINVHDLAKLFERDEKTIRKHINNILNEECNNSDVAFFATTALDGKTYNVAYYNLNVIISLGYRFKSKRGILFRKWANSVLKQYLLNSYSINNKTCIECKENIITLNNVSAART